MQSIPVNQQENAFSQPKFWALSPNGWLILICLFHLIFWTVLPAVLRHSIPMDTAEGIAWGNQWQLGYDKHPMLAPWLTALATHLGGSVVWPVFLLSQIAVVAAFVGVFTLAKQFVSKWHALVGVMLLEGVVYYTSQSTQFNPNVLMLPLWIWTSYFFYRAITTKQLLSWCMVGLFAGLAMLAKYQSVVLLLPMFSYLLVNRQARQSFKAPGFYMALVSFLLVISPNVYWLWQNDFIPFTYTLDRVGSHRIAWLGFLNHLYFPLRFFVQQLLNLLPILLLFLPFIAARKTSAVLKPQQRQFLWFIGVGPLIVTLLISLVGGFWLHGLWAFPLFNLAGLLLVTVRKPELTRKNMGRFFIVWLVIAVLWLTLRFTILLMDPHWRHKLHSAQYPAPEIAQSVTMLWHASYNKPLPYVAGEQAFVEYVATYSKDQPVPYFGWNVLSSAWVNDESVKRDGAVFLWTANMNQSQYGLPQDIRKRFPRLKAAMVKTFPYATSADIAPMKVGIAILPPRGI